MIRVISKYICLDTFSITYFELFLTKSVDYDVCFFLESRGFGGI